MALAMALAMASLRFLAGLIHVPGGVVLFIVSPSAICAGVA
jgi:hypothetical protein